MISVTLHYILPRHMWNARDLSTTSSNDTQRREVLCWKRVCSHYASETGSYVGTLKAPSNVQYLTEAQLQLW